MQTSAFQQARLIPTIGIKGEIEQERRTTSAFLAILTAVPEFAKALMKPLGAPAGRLSAFIEPEFLLGERKVRPDGLITIERGGKTWSALVEVKTGKSPLELAQINDYLDVCRENGIDALLTISNQVLTLSGEHPTKGLDGRKLKKTTLIHYSWIRILTEALVQKEHRGIADPDQAWILGELIRYLQHPASGATEFDDMGAGWTDVLRGIGNGTLAASDPKVVETVNSFESLTRFVALRLSAKLGVEVVQVAPKIAQLDPRKHQQQSVADFLSSGKLSGSIRIPNTSSDIAVFADLRAKSITCSVDIDAPLEGRNLTRINWLLRQVKNTPEGLRIEVRVKRSTSSFVTAAMYASAIEKPAVLLPPSGADILGFRLTLIQTMGTKRGDGAGSFVATVVESVELGYQVLLENLKSWSAKAPRLGVVDSDPSGSPFDPVGADSMPLPGDSHEVQKELLAVESALNE
jgi:hypothetical protein